MSPSKDWGQNHVVQLTPEQIITWLEGIRTLTIEIWKKNPELRRQWEKLNRRESSPP